MRVLLDHNVPKYLVRFSGSFEVVRAAQLGWQKLSNGNLLRAAAEQRFDAVITLDKDFEDLGFDPNRSLRLIVIRTKSSNSRSALRPLYARALAQLPDMELGCVEVVDDKEGRQS